MYAIVFYTALVLGAPALKEKVKPEPTIVGEWAVESVSVHGELTKPGSNRWVFNADGSRAIYLDGKQLQSGTYTCHPAATPATLDLHAPRGPQPKNRCLFRIDGDTMTLSVGHENTERPTDLEPGRNRTVWVFKRVAQP